MEGGIRIFIYGGGSLCKRYMTGMGGGGGGEKRGTGGDMKPGSAASVAPSLVSFLEAS